MTLPDHRPTPPDPYIAGDEVIRITSIRRGQSPVTVGTVVEASELEVKVEWSDTQAVESFDQRTASLYISRIVRGLRWERPSKSS